MTDELGLEEETPKKRRGRPPRAAVAELQVDEEPKVEEPDFSANAPMVYEPCSWCGGKKKSALPLKPDKADPKFDEKMRAWVKEASACKSTVKVAFTVYAPKRKDPLLCCAECLYRIFNATLGQAKHHGQEMDHLTGRIQNTGFFPERR